MHNKVTDETYLLKLMTAGVPADTIAKRLGITPEEVHQRWALLQEKMKALQKSGYQALVDQFTMLCAQYQLLGESLKIIAGALGNEVSPEEVKASIVANPEQTYQNLAQYIILHPFVPVSPEESLKRTLEGN